MLFDYSFGKLINYKQYGSLDQPQSFIERLQTSLIFDNHKIICINQPSVFLKFIKHMTICAKTSKPQFLPQCTSNNQSNVFNALHDHTPNPGSQSSASKPKYRFSIRIFETRRKTKSEQFQKKEGHVSSCVVFCGVFRCVRRRH